jgi:hypothetical protein
MKISVVTISLLLIVCLSAVCCGADSRMKSLSVSGDLYQEDNIKKVFQGETLKIVFSFDESAKDYNYTPSFDKGKISLLNQSRSGRKCTFYLKVAPGAKIGASDVTINLIGTQSDKSLGDATIRLQISEPYEIDEINILSPRGGENDSKRVYFLAESGLSEEEEAEINLKYQWKIYNEQGKSVATITGNGEYHRLSDGLYRCKYSISDKLGRVWEGEFDFGVGNVKFTYKKTKIEISKTKNAAVVGEDWLLDLTGTYCDGNCTIYISDGKGWNGMAYYYVPGSGKKSILKLGCKFDEPGVYIFTVEVRKFTKEKPLATATIQVVVGGNVSQAGVEQNSGQSYNDYSGTSHEEVNWSYERSQAEKQLEKVEARNKQSPGFGFLTCVIMLVCVSISFKKKE